MIAQGFKSVGWVASAGAAALSCYMVSLNVASERAELLELERKIVETKQEIRSLHTELGTRGRMAQLDRWNAEVLALSAPTAAQFLQNEYTLARFDRTESPFEDKARVQMASAEVEPEAATADRPKVIYASASVPAEEPALEAQPKPLVRRASASVLPEKPAPSRKAQLLDPGVLEEIGSAANSEESGGQ